MARPNIHTPATPNAKHYSSRTEGGGGSMAQAIEIPAAAFAAFRRKTKNVPCTLGEIYSVREVKKNADF